MPTKARTRKLPQREKEGARRIFRGEMPREEDAAQQACALPRAYSLVVFLYEVERGGIDAVAETGRPRAVRKNVAEVRVAAAA
jgi:hypothetical protein